MLMPSFLAQPIPWFPLVCSSMEFVAEMVMDKLPLLIKTLIKAVYKLLPSHPIKCICLFCTNNKWQNDNVYIWLFFIY